MQFVAKEDTNTPINELFAAMSDFERFERSAIRRGVDVQRIGTLAELDNGLGWNLSFDLRGVRRNVKLKMAEYTTPTLVKLDAEGTGVFGELTVELIALSPKRTRLTVTMVLKPRTLSGRVLLQSLKLARSKIARNYRKRVSDFVDIVAGRSKTT